MKMPIDLSEDAKFQMAPMIDMVFLLLIFFMCASTLSQNQSLKLKLPEAGKGVIPKERPDRWVVNVLKDGSVHSGVNPVTIEQLKGMLAARVKQDASTKVYLRADAETRHAEVRRVITAMAEAGVDDFIFAVFTPGAEVVP
jgi:biopolymer transport protein ExbD